MSSKTMRNYVVMFCCAMVGMLLNSCQKELTGTVDSLGCKVQQFTYLNANGGISSNFSYSYDSATAKPTQLVYTDSLGLQTIVVPTFKGDTVFFSNGSYAVLDGSRTHYALGGKEWIFSPMEIIIISTMLVGTLIKALTIMAPIVLYTTQHLQVMRLLNLPNLMVM